MKMILTPEAKHWYLDALDRALERLSYRRTCTKYASKEALDDVFRKLMKHRDKVLAAEERITNENH